MEAPDVALDASPVRVMDVRTAYERLSNAFFGVPRIDGKPLPVGSDHRGVIRDRNALTITDAREVALDCIEAGIRAADPECATRAAVTVDGDSLVVTGATAGGDPTTVDLAEFDRVLVLGGGKAAPGVVRALVDGLGDRVDGGLVVVPEDDPSAGDEIGVVDVATGGHPVPTEAGAEATSGLLDVAESADERTLVLAVVTGGGSALLAAPAGDLTVTDLQHGTRALLDAGADITELNAVRKHCSRIKGGGLARIGAPATVVGLVVSDVVGDDLGVVASGPTAPDETTFADALAVLDRYEIDAPAVQRHLERGAVGESLETPKPGDELFERVSNHVVASNRTAVDAAADVARDRGFAACVLSTRVRGESRESARTHVAIAEEVAAAGDPVDPPAVMLSGGETTVTVEGDGTGGPNLEFALASAIELDCVAAVAAVDTDGRDGSTDAAGAIVDEETLPDRESLTAARSALADNDSLPWLESTGGVIRTGSTGTNVNDLRVLVVPGG